MRGAWPTAAPRRARDGRVERGQRNQARLVDAIWSLLRERPGLPSREEIAARAGLSLRTVYRHIENAEALTTAISARLEAEVRPLFLEAPPFEGSTGERVRELVRRRGEIHGRLAPFRRAASPADQRLPRQVEGRAQLEAASRAQLEAALGAELDAGDDDLPALLTAVLSFETWSRMRTEQQLDAARTARLLERAVLALLPPSR